MKQTRLHFVLAALLSVAGAMSVQAATLNINPRVLPEGATVTITYVETSDTWPNPSNEDFTFRWGDGTQTNCVNTSQSTFNLQHVYGDNGSSIMISVTEGGSTISDFITVTNVPPTTDLPPEINLPPGQPLNQALHITDPGRDTFTATINYGDGSPITTLTLGTNRNFALNHVYPADGAYNLELTIADDDTGSSTRRAAVIVGTAPGPQLSLFTLAGLIVQGIPGRTYEIQKRDRLEESGWLPVGSVTLTNSAQTWIDYNSTNSPNRFYRAVESP